MAATVRKLVVEVMEARNLRPKDSTGTSSPYARADYDGQRHKMRTVARDLNPAWNEALEFNFPGAGVVDLVAGELLDVRVGPRRHNNFLSRVSLNVRQFVRKGEEALIYSPLEKKSFFSWVRGDIGLKVYYVDEPLMPEPAPDPPAGDPVADATAVKEAKEAPPPAPEAVLAPADPPPAQTEEWTPPTEAPEIAAAEAPPAGDDGTTEKPAEKGTATLAPEDVHYIMAWY